MKMTQSSAIICEVCRQGVRHHHGPGSAFVEMVRGSDGVMQKRFYHAKRCWPQERRRRKKLERRIARERASSTERISDIDREIQTAMKIERDMDHKMEAPVATQRPNTMPGAKRGLGIAAYEILDAVPVGQEWKIEDLIAALAARGMTTTKATVQQLSWSYRHIRRDAVVVRREGVGKHAHTKIMRFDIPAPSEAIGRVSPSKNKAERAKQFVTPIEKPQPLQEPQLSAPPHEPVLTRAAPPPQTRPLAKPAPTPGLTHADLNRAFNDFQAFILEAITDFRNDLLKRVK